MRRDGAAHNLSSVKLRTVTGVVAVAVPELRTRRADFYADEGSLEPRLVNREGGERRGEQKERVENEG